MSNSINRVQKVAEPEPLQLPPQPKRSWKSLLAIGLVVAGAIATILWTILLGVIVVYLIFTR
jgi:hypothetical protein